MPTENQNSDNVPYVVGIGASAGGLEALQLFFQNMPAETGLIFVVVQHLSPDFQSLMDELLARYTRMPIYRVEDAMAIMPNSIYLIPPRKNIALANGRLHLLAQEPQKKIHLPIDIFFQSLAVELKERAIGVVLSGTGSDGSTGLREIAHQGGLVLVQDETSAKFDGMPRSAIATGLVDVVAHAEEMPDLIVNYQRDPVRFRATLGDAWRVDGDNVYANLFQLMRKKFQIDFNYYKVNTILRRLQRRMDITHQGDINQYLEYLQEHEEEIDLLYRDFLVEVTQFFRDKEAFELLRLEVLPQLFTQREEGKKEVRLWVPGCATGEEAYSLAILCWQYVQENNLDIEIKVFATDVHRNSLDIASKGVYTASKIEQIPYSFAQQYFVPTENGEYRVAKSIRRLVIFAPQNLTNDPPFTKMDLISCRNVLIYLRSETQQQILRRFHFSLRQGGVLFLGPSEQVGDLEEEFSLIDRRWRLYRKRRDVRLDMNNLQNTLQLSPIIGATQPASKQSRYQSVWKDALLTEFIPDSFLVNERDELIYTFGDAGRYFQTLAGEMSNQVLKLVLEPLMMPLRAALHRAHKEGVQIVYAGIRLEVQGKLGVYKLVVDPVPVADNDVIYYLVRLHEVKEVEEVKEDESVEASPLKFEFAEQQHIADLERELRYTRQHLQTTIEELETTNEELQSTNEELIASNEELQSTNEELHSVNEELYTVNLEYQHKIDELTQLNNDMRNLQRSTQIGTVFLNRELVIRHFTPMAQKLMHLLPQDIGRPVAHLLYHVQTDADYLLELMEDVLKTGTRQELDVSLNREGSYLLRLLPYFDEAEAIDGVILTFIDITEHKQVERELARRSRWSEMNRVFTDAPVGIVLLEGEDHVVSLANPTSQHIFQGQLILGKPLAELWPNSEQHSLLQTVQTVYETGEMRDFNELSMSDLWDEEDGPELYLNILYQPWVMNEGDRQGVMLFIVDVTELVLTRQLLMQESNFINSLMAHANSVIFMKDLEGRYLLVNDSWREAIGFDGEVLGKTDFDFVPEKVATRWQNEDRKVMRLNRPIEHEEVSVLNGESVTYWTTKFPIRDDDGVLYAVGGITSDISLLKQTEAQVEQLSQLVAQAGAAIVSLTINGQVQSWNLGAQQLLGYDAEEAMGQVMGYFVSSGQQKEVHEYVQRVVEGGEAAVNAEISCVTKSGRVVEVTAVFSPVYDAYKNIQSVAWIMQDVTARRSMEQALRHSELRLRTILDSAVDAIVTINEKGVIEEVNQAVNAIFGYDVDDLMGKDLQTILPPPRDEEEPDFWKRYLQVDKQKLGRGHRVYGLHHDGHSFPIDLVMTEVWLGSRRLFTAIMRDVTQQVAIEQRLIMSKDEAEQANAAKSAFLANMSHEIRTPLNALIGMSRLLNDTVLNEEQQELVGLVQKSSHTLLRLVNDILDLSKIEAEQFFLDTATFDLRNCLETAGDIIIWATVEKGLTLIYQFSPELPRYVYGDGDRLQQVLVNLLNNAIKFTKEGNIILGCEPTEEEDLWHFWVKDEGIGIPEAKMSELFQVFHRLDMSVTRETEGAGLGLAISKHLVGLMDGEIWVDSVEGEGSQFHFTVKLPARGHSSVYDVVEGNEEIAAKHILLWDNNQERMHAYEMMLTSFDCRVTTISLAAEVVHLLRGEHGYDIALLNGDIQISQRLMENLVGSDDIDSVVMIIGAPLGYDIKPTVAKRAAVIAQPTKIQELHHALLTVLRGEELAWQPQMMAEPWMASESQLPAVEQWGQKWPLYILLAEDNVINQQVMVMTLNKMGYQIDVADNGVMAIEMVKNHVYDLIFMDLQMPKLDGLGATEQIRQLLPSHLQPYIVAMTARATTEDRQKCFDAGMNDYVSKPFALEELQRVLVIGYEQRVSLRPHQEALIEERSQVAWSALKELFADQPEEFAILLKSFIEDSDELLARTTEALDNQDWEEIRAIMHTLETSAMYFGFSDWVKVIKRVREAGHKENFVLLSKAVEQLLKDYEQIKIELSEELTKWE
ncbi:MAG TPA: PAS domain S-box protein [Anaerolineae bacterium]|nr:PAS domain S-box protein [Anaerolineae bacterium]